MKTKTFKKIQKNSVKMGDKTFKEFNKTGALDYLKASNRAYNTAMRTVLVQLMYNQTKK